MKSIVTAACLAMAGFALAAPAFAQETGITVRSIRVLASDPEALAKFYAQALGMSETRRPVDTATFKEIVLNTGSTPELAKKAPSAPIVIASRGNGPQAGGMAALILEVPDMDKAIARATAAGAKLMRPVAKTGEGLFYAFLTDPDGNQFEFILRP